MPKQIHKCAYCGEEMTGCPCAWVKTSDGKVAHQKCIKDYEKSLKHTKPTCAYCGLPFVEPPYFKGEDGKDVHFKCRNSYNIQLKNKK